MQANNYDVPVLVDDASSVALNYGVSGIPTTFFISRTGIIEYIQLGMFTSLNQLQGDLNKIP
jgi:hypothetical protein